MAKTTTKELGLIIKRQEKHIEILTEINSINHELLQWQYCFHKAIEHDIEGLRERAFDCIKVWQSKYEMAKDKLSKHLLTPQEVKEDEEVDNE